MLYIYGLYHLQHKFSNYTELCFPIKWEGTEIDFYVYSPPIVQILINFIICIYYLYIYMYKLVIRRNPAMGIWMLKFPRIMRRLQYLIKEVPDFPDINILDEQTLLNTQREDWLLPTEPVHGARPRQTGGERPPVIENRLPIEATGGAASRKPGRPPCCRRDGRFRWKRN